MDGQGGYPQQPHPQHPSSWYSSAQFQFQAPQAPHHQQSQQWIPPPPQPQPQPQQQSHQQYGGYQHPPQQHYPPVQYPPPPPRPMPPHNPQVTQMYAPPDQGWSSSNWNQYQSQDFTGMSSGVNNEEDWAAKARAWAAAKAADESQQAQSQLTQTNRSSEHQQFQDDYGRPLQPQYYDAQQSSYSQQPMDSTFSSSSYPSHIQDMSTNLPNGLSSSYAADGFASYNSNNAALNDTNGLTGSSQRILPGGSSSYLPEVSRNYSPAPGSGEHLLGNQSTLSPPIGITEDNQQPKGELQSSSDATNHSQGALPPQYPYLEQTLPAHGFTMQPTSEYVTQDLSQSHLSGYQHLVPSVGMDNTEYNGQPTTAASWNPQLSGPSTSFSSIPSVTPNNQFEQSYLSGPHPTLTAQYSGRPVVPPHASGFRPNLPPIGGPFGLGTANSVLPPGSSMIPSSYMSDTSAGFGVPERPKKASVPNWLKEEILKKKVGAMPHSSTQGSALESSFNATATAEVVDNFRNTERSEHKSPDNSHNSQNDEDEEDDTEAARTAAINKEIKRILTELLMKVTNDLFNEIAQEVLDEDDSSSQGVNKSGEAGLVKNKSSFKASSPPLHVASTATSGRVVVSVKNAVNDTKSDSDNTSASMPAGNLLGLANYVSDDENDVTQDNDKSELPQNSEHKEEFRDKEKEGKGSYSSPKEGSYENMKNAEDDIVNKKSMKPSESDRPKPNLFSQTLETLENEKNRDKVNLKSEHEDVILKKKKPESLGTESDRKTASKNGTRGGDSVGDQDKAETKNRNLNSREIDKIQHSKEKGNEIVKDREKERTKDRAYEKVKEKEKDREKIRSEEKRRMTEKMHDSERRRGHDDDKPRKSNDKEDVSKRSDKERMEKRERGREKYASSAGRGRRRSLSVSSKDRSSKHDSHETDDSNSSGAIENAKRRRVRSGRCSPSKSPTRSRKRRVTRSRSPSPRRRHSHRRHSPYPSNGSRSRRSPSKSPAHRKRRN